VSGGGGGGADVDDVGAPPAETLPRAAARDAACSARPTA